MSKQKVKRDALAKHNLKQPGYEMLMENGRLGERNLALASRVAALEKALRDSIPIMDEYYALWAKLK